MPTGNIDDLLKEDETRLKAKRTRLSTYGKAVENARAASQKAQQTAAKILDAGDLTRTDLATVFNLSKAERATLVPAAPKRSSTTSETPQAVKETDQS